MGGTNHEEAKQQQSTQAVEVGQPGKEARAKGIAPKQQEEVT